MKRIITLTISMAVMASFGAKALRVGDSSVSKKEIMHVAEKVYASKCNASVKLSVQDEQDIINDVIEDHKFWIITREEYDRRHLSVDDVKSQSSLLSEMGKIAKYIDNYNR